ncbi:hypothetical protein [Methyloraptor flagellatus]|uniref:Uncharacterized protein n=1 Tax=Methyloraptor flagellatus TaxID=3162530 RepID=A0AAU7XCH5_9HYPH
MSVAPVKQPMKAADAAMYIEQATAELRDMAHRTGLPFIAYLLDMARQEAAAETGTYRREPGGRA